jgi:DNA-directed RNA polymerase subunit M/transcription elongation factor TFIIS
LQTNQSCGKMETNKRRVLCPACGKKTVLWLLPTTQVKDLPVVCKKCGKESVLNIPLEPVP